VLFSAAICGRDYFSSIPHLFLFLGDADFLLFFSRPVDGGATWCAVPAGLLGLHANTL